MKLLHFSIKIVYILNINFKKIISLQVAVLLNLFMIILLKIIVKEMLKVKSVIWNAYISGDNFLLFAFGLTGKCGVDFVASSWMISSLY